MARIVRVIQFPSLEMKRMARMAATLALAAAMTKI
jgi:hypothetical protein